MKKKEKDKLFDNLPVCAAEFIRLVIRKMRYRKKVRQDVQAELATHFEDELKDCKSDDDKEQKAQKLTEQFGDGKLLAVLLRRAKKRCRPLWRTIVASTLQTIGALVLCFIFYCVYISLGKPTVAVNYVEEAVRLARPTVDESLNAAPLYQSAIDNYKEPPKTEREKEYPVGRPKIGERLDTKIKTRIEKVSLLEAIRGKDWIAELNREELDLLKQWLCDNAETIEFFKQASEKPHCWWQRQAKDNVVLNVLMPESASMRNLVKMMVWQAKLKAYDGDIEGAFEDLLSCYQTGQHYKGPRSLVEQIVGIAIESIAVKNSITILSNREINGQLLKSFQGKLNEQMANSSYVINYKTERFLALDFIQRCYTDNGRGSGHMIPGRLKEFMNVIDYSPRNKDATEKAVLDYARCLAMAITVANRREMWRVFDKFYSNAQEGAYMTPWQLREKNIDFEIVLSNWSFFKKVRYLPVGIFMPAGHRIIELSCRSKAHSKAVLTIIAVLRYKQELGGYPENPDKLIEAGYLRELPMDPYSDRPLIYRKTDEGFTLYSVGPNFEDDGGQSARGKKGKPRVWADEGDAVFWPVPKSEVKQ